jgi:hypothetical protein
MLRKRKRKQEAVPETRLPAFDAPPHLTSGHGALAIWLVEPMGMLTQLRRPTHMTPELAEFISELAYSALLEICDDNRQPLTFVHDFSLLTGYDSEARRILTMWGLRITKRIERVVVIQPPIHSELARLGIHAAASALSLVGVRFEIVDSIVEPLEKYALRPAAPRG